MKKILVLLAILTIGFSSKAQSLEEATAAYSKGEFGKAAEIYENLLKTNGESAELYYNIGNCYYRLNKTASAILNYERALLIHPGDKDTRMNLDIVKLKAIDRIEPVDEFFLTEWVENVQNMFSANAWSYSGVTCFLLLIGCLVGFFFSRKIILKKCGFYVGIGMIVLCISCNIFAYNQKKKLTNRNAAVVFAPTVTIKSTPDNSGADLFILHEGAKVIIKSKLGNWNEIETADGNIGWIKIEYIEVI
ncbi:MAG: tetratricopeptide repeat protein [Dysgonamonadaceae bacterium]|jgi:tetratricopeptide (TPR) repeat protein|nr:tetratricopeptide repeat protein [Dysgonamonadaceae bacterium]